MSAAIPIISVHIPYSRTAVATSGARGILDLIGLMRYYDLMAMLLLTGNAVPPQDGEVPSLQTAAR